MKITIDILKPWRWWRSDKVWCRNCENKHLYTNYFYCSAPACYTNKKKKCKYFKQKK